MSENCPTMLFLFRFSAVLLSCLLLICLFFVCWQGPPGPPGPMGPVGQPGPAVSTNFNSLKTESDSLQPIGCTCSRFYESLISFGAS